MLHTLVRWLLIGSVALFIFSFWHRNDLPQPAQLPPQLSQAPIQIQVNQPVIDNAGNGGDAGDYAVNGNSYITWVATGTRYGAIV